jgi:cytochrome P450
MGDGEPLIPSSLEVDIVLQVMDHLLTLFVAGHETLANALTWACYLLAQHPHVMANWRLHPLWGGPRRCLGAPFAMMELKTVLTMLVQSFRLDLTPHQRVEATVCTTLQPRYGLLMKPQVQDGHTERSPARVLGNVVGTIPQSH